MSSSMTREEKVRIAVDMRINGAKLREIGERLGVTRQRAEQLLRGTEVDGMFRVDVEMRRREEFAAHQRRIVSIGPSSIKVACEMCGKEAVIANRSKAHGCRDCYRSVGPRKDLAGQTFGDWTVIEWAKAGSFWRCRCKCGQEADVWLSNLTSGKSNGCRPCGIKRREENRAKRRA